MYHVFVYGTLKVEFPNYKLNHGRKINGTFVTKHRYPLYLVGDRFSPWLILDKGKGHYVRGQVFQVDESTLEIMDKLERINELDGYGKIEIPVISVEDDDELVVFVYGKPIDQLKDADLRSEPLEEYQLEHAALYRSRSS